MDSHYERMSLMSTPMIVVLLLALTALSGPVGVALIWLLVNYMPH